MAWGQMRVKVHNLRSPSWRAYMEAPCWSAPLGSMIVTCPACTAAFDVPDSALGSSGRKVRCSGCGHVWRAGGVSPAEAEALDPGADPGATPAQEERRPVPDAWPEAAEPDETSGSVPAFETFDPHPLQLFDEQEDETPRMSVARRRSPGLIAGWLVLALVLIALPLLAWTERERVVAALPESAALYALFGINAETPLARLTLQDVTLVRRQVDGRSLLTVDGEALNHGSQEVRLPPLRARLLDREGAVLQSWTFSAERGRLGPGEATTFHTEVEDVPDETSINIEFLPGAEG